VCFIVPQCCGHRAAMAYAAMSWWNGIVFTWYSEHAIWKDDGSSKKIAVLSFAHAVQAKHHENKGGSLKIFRC
jgi:hypothetical protein